MQSAVDTDRLDFHAPTKALFNLQTQVTKGFKTKFRRRRRRRRRLISELGFEKLKITSWHIQTLPHQIPSTFGWVCPYSNQNLVGERPTWEPTLRI